MIIQDSEPCVVLKVMGWIATVREVLISPGIFSLVKESNKIVVSTKGFYFFSLMGQALSDHHFEDLLLTYPHIFYTIFLHKNDH